MHVLPTVALAVKMAALGPWWISAGVSPMGLLYGALFIWLSRRLSWPTHLGDTIFLLVWLSPGSVVLAALVAGWWWGAAWGVATGVVWAGVHGFSLATAILAYRARKAAEP